MKKAPAVAGTFWWGKVDSNHRSRRQQIYSLPHLTALEFPHMKFGAGGRIRTPDLLITNQLLYQLSYTSSSNSRIYSSRPKVICQQKKSFFSVLFYFALPARKTAQAETDLERRMESLRRTNCAPIRGTLRCSFCGLEITEGERYWYCNGRTACAVCLPEFARQELAPFCRTRGREGRR